MKLQVVFEGASLEEINEQIETYVNGGGGSIPPAIEVPSNITAAGNVASVGKEWKPVDGKSNAYSGSPLVDSRGMPFDDRIHVSPEKTNKNGTWLNKRIGKEKIAEIEAELRGRGTSNSVPPFGSMTPEQYAAHVSPASNLVPFPGSPAPVQQVAPPTAPAAPVVQPPMGAAHAHNLDTFKKNMPLVLMELTNTNESFRNYIPSLKAHFKVNELVDLINNEQGIKVLFDTLVQYKFVKSM